MTSRSSRDSSKCVRIRRVLVVLALTAGTALLAFGARDRSRVALRLPENRVYTSEASPAPVVFRHTTHVEFADRHCQGCHPRPFSILGRHVPVTHEDMQAGRVCGSCHDGRVAFATDDFDACETCHSGVEDGS